MAADIARQGVLKTDFSKLQKKGFQKKKFVSFHHTSLNYFQILSRKENLR